MKLQLKLALFNALSKGLLVLLVAIILPKIVSETALVNTDKRLEEKRDKVLSIIDSVGMDNFLEVGGDRSYGSYNLLKEEFISLEEVDAAEDINGIENSQRKIDGEILDYRVLSHTFQEDDHIYLLEIARSVDTISEAESTLRMFGIFLSLIIVLITVFIELGFTSYLLIPFNKIINAKLKQVGDVSSFNFEKIATSTSDFQYLDVTINEMMTKIAASFHKERQFISNVSHEVLTPVSILQTKLENVLVSESISPEDEEKILECLKTISRLKNIIKALLLISRIENEQYIKADKVSIKEVVEEAMAELEDRVAEKELSTQLLLEQDTYIMANKPLIFTLIFNLVNNGIKYNKVKGSLIIRGKSQEGSFTLSIQDSGIGIKEEYLSSIFNRFKRFAGADSESFGLGLPIVKTISDFHKITINVSSTYGAGTTFELVFPKIPS
jgi:signal transduction histidine kinase